MASSIRWYGDQVRQAIRERMRVRLHRAAQAVAQKIRENIGTPAPPHSAPGEFPHVVSGELLRSVGVETDKNSLTSRIVVTADHASEVEEKRPFLRRTLREMRPALRRILLRRLVLDDSGGGRYGSTE